MARGEVNPLHTRLLYTGPRTFKATGGTDPLVWSTEKGRAT